MKICSQGIHLDSKVFHIYTGVLQLEIFLQGVIVEVNCYQKSNYDFNKKNKNDPNDSNNFVIGLKKIQNLKYLKIFYTWSNKTYVVLVAIYLYYHLLEEIYRAAIYIYI